MADDNAILAILNRLEKGEISTAEAHAEILLTKKDARKGQTTAPTKTRGRPKGHTARRGAKMVGIAAYWVLLDKVPRMELRALLADAFGVEASYVGKVVARLNKLLDAGAVAVRGISEHGPCVYFLSPLDIERLARGDRLGIHVVRTNSNDLLYAKAPLTETNG